MTAKFFDPLRIISLVIVLFKMFFQDLCESQIDWDEPLSGDILNKWNQQYPYYRSTSLLLQYYTSKDVKMIGFCDASSKAYAAVEIGVPGENYS